jgi:serine/threonine protein kinase
MPGTLGNFNVLRTLGKGASCKVKLAQDPETGRKVAIKIMNDNMDPNMKQLVMTEVKAMDQLKHKHVINQVEYGTGIYKKPNKEKEVSYIVLELALGGELFDYIANSGRFEEPLARYFFKQFLEGLDYCHQNGVAHRDLKPENLLLCHNFSLKIADFGFAAPVEGKDGSGNLTTKLGTLNYMAPEIHLKQPYQGRSVDLFAAAIILFIMVSAHPPFTTAEPQDPFYRCIAASRADIFWRTHCKSKENGEKFFSEEFKDIVQAMLQLDPAHRPSIPEVLAHPWMQGPVPSYEEVLAEFTERESRVKDAMEAERKVKDEEKARQMTNRRTEAHRGVSKVQNDAQQQFDNSDESIFKPSKPLEEYEKIFGQNTEFFSTYNPDMIEE